jgi:hypothetical protein
MESFRAGMNLVKSMVRVFEDLLPVVTNVIGKRWWTRMNRKLREWAREGSNHEWDLLISCQWCDGLFRAGVAT